MIKINRWYHKDCTIGLLSINGINCFTLELPNKNNKTNISCIPEGTYKYHARLSNRNGMVLQLENVENRSYIQIHSGNYTSQIKGCILVGDSIKYLNNDNIPDITNSKNTLKRILESVGDSGKIKIWSN